MKKSDGFTLVELMVGILCATLVSGAVITFMLMGVRTNRSVLDANSEQRNAKIVITMMENLASEGSIQSVGYLGAEGESNQDWSILDTSGAAILSYSGASQSLRGRNGSILMEGVLDSSLSLETDNILSGCLLKFSLKTKNGSYDTSVFCRISNIDTDTTTLDKNTGNIVVSPEITGGENITLIPTSHRARLSFLQTLASQYGSEGIIVDTPDKTYTQWYCEAETGNDGYFPGWGINTPWCATFVSWAIAQNEVNLNYTPETLPREANVDNLWLSDNTDFRYLRTNTNFSPTPGDLIFFDWDRNTTSDTSPDLEHVGVVLYVDNVNRLIYTIEGNSGGRVALRRYSLDDQSIYGYAVLNWKTTTP